MSGIILNVKVLNNGIGGHFADNEKVVRPVTISMYVFTSSS